MADPGLSLGGLAFLGAGLVLTYSGLNDPVGGPFGAVRDILSGKTPTPQLPTVTATTPSVATDAGTTIAGAVGTIAAAGSRASIMGVAKSYIGTPYRLGGASRKGIDCSGLVLVAYRDGAKIKLPHKATLQMARGKRITRAQIQAGDLVGWGVPGNYPHIALAVDQNTVLVAPTWGKKVMYQTLWQKKVPGFGYPDIVRILGS
jgi:cell wall-associated NlpC family hydrolase